MTSRNTPKSIFKSPILTPPNTTIRSLSEIRPVSSALVPSAAIKPIQGVTTAITQVQGHNSLPSCVTLSRTATKKISCLLN